MSGTTQSRQTTVTSETNANSCGGDYVVTAHEMISSPQSNYEVLELLGTSVSGEVCFKERARVSSHERVCLSCERIGVCISHERVCLSCERIGVMY